MGLTGGLWRWERQGCPHGFADPPAAGRRTAVAGAGRGGLPPPPRGLSCRDRAGRGVRSPHCRHFRFRSRDFWWRAPELPSCRGHGPLRNTPVPPRHACRPSSSREPGSGRAGGGSSSPTASGLLCSVADTGPLQPTCRNARRRPAPVPATSRDGRPACSSSKCGDASGLGAHAPLCRSQRRSARDGQRYGPANLGRRGHTALAQSRP